MIWPHDHKLRKYLSLKLDYKFIDIMFQWFAEINKVYNKIFSNYWLINKTTATVILDVLSI